MKLEWKVFPHQGREDFREKLRAFSQVILVDAEQYAIYPGETSKGTGISGGKSDGKRNIAGKDGKWCL